MTHKTYSAKFKLALLDEAAATEGGVPAVAAKHGVKQSLIYNWRKNRRALEKKSNGGGNGVPQVERDRAVAALNDGGNAKEIAAGLKVTATSLYNWRKKSNVPARAGAEAREYARAVGRERAGERVADATRFLRSAKHDIVERIKTKRTMDFTRAELLSLLALNVIEHD